jgi:hypothetical protein
MSDKELWLEYGRALIHYQISIALIHLNWKALRAREKVLRWGFNKLTEKEE